MPLAGLLLSPRAEWIAAGALFCAALVAGRLLRVRAPSREAYRRGAIVRPSQFPSALASAASFAWRRARRFREIGDAAPLSLGGIALQPQDEVKHFKFIGTTGTGKTTAIGALLRAALARGDRAVITDPDGAYLRPFYDCYRGDAILNPFEPHSARWDPLAEVRGRYGYEELARGLIPRTGDASGREWRAYARTFVAAVLSRCDALGARDVGELWRVLAIAGSDEVREVVTGTPAQPFLDPDNSRMFGSIRSVAVSAIAALEHIAAQRAGPLSIRNWLQRGRGALFLPYRAGEIAALRSIVATWMRIAIFEVMSRPDDGAGPVWFVVDELDALGAIDGLKDALARLRKFGGRCVLGFQSIAQVSSTYGGGEAQTLVENCGNTLILRCSGSENGGTSQFASRLIGEREVVHRSIARTRDHGCGLASRGSRRSTQVSEARVLEAAVLPAEVEQLPDLAGYFKTASSPHWVRISLTREARRWRSTTSG